ncbi:NAD(P)-dependent oxidoreductase [Polaromonas sp. CG_9.11]|uniref:NAD-dependent epimerase/dehydratase family protein n=1 Tax=Polaromonas sp. CG_9.11 TaxID=2787730 RepID=UPI0018CB1388|nr:NAD(P)-dependent oxidoreductase [Polaromonas sp. CG_9.11]MBG6078129.1 nucleoside-diphosphate-sugar epimerase [Polaromonas sp. CG_9.11]
MKVLVLGGSGYIGKRLLETLANASLDRLTGASRGLAVSPPSGVDWIKLDTCNVSELKTVLQNFDAIVNCVAGDARSIAQGTKTLTDAARQAGNPRIVHLSTMSVYGPIEGNIQEETPLNPGLGWYGRAKIEAEHHIGDYVRKGGKAVLLRPGCVFGPNSELWVGRIARWLRAGRLGDLGPSGDGWSNLVHVDDVCQAILSALRLPINPGKVPVFNLAAPDSPRWNRYFIDLALALEFTPVRRINQRQLQLDGLLAGPPLKLMQMVSKRFRWPASTLPDYMTSGLMGLWAQHIHLDSTQASQHLELVWTTYTAGLRSSVAWEGKQAINVGKKDRAACTR